MKQSHHVPLRQLRAEPISPEYQAEVDTCTDRSEAAYRRAADRLARAELRLHVVQTRAVRQAASARRRQSVEHELAVALELVELRREELQRIEALMKGIPASVAHRGRRGYRPIPQPGSVL